MLETHVWRFGNTKEGGGDSWGWGEGGGTNEGCECSERPWLSTRKGSAPGFTQFIEDCAYNQKCLKRDEVCGHTTIKL